MSRKERSLVRRWWWVLAAVALAVTAALAFLSWNATRVSWAKVREAYGKQQTINGVGQATDAQGRTWQIALWVQVVSPTQFVPNQIVIPPKGAPSGPDSELVMLVSSLDYTSGANYLPGFAESGALTRGKPTEWGGKPALEAVIQLPRTPHTQPSAASPPDRLHFYLDPKTRLIRALEVFKGDKLRASAEYSYNKPLPQGFRPN